MNKILVEISVGELLDKISILEIKQYKIKDPKKLKFIEKEHIILNDQLKINYRKIITEFGKGTKINYGFKLQSSPSSDPFKTIQYHNLNSNAQYPVLRIIYVK